MSAFRPRRREGWVWAKPRFFGRRRRPEVSVVERTLRRMGIEFDQLVAEIERNALDAVAGLLRSHGVCPRPTVFMFSGLRSPTFMGTVTAPG